MEKERTNNYYLGDCKYVLDNDISEESIDLIYLDPPFFTGDVQKGEWKPGAMEISFEDSKEFWRKKGLHENAPQWMKDIAQERPAFASYLHYMMKRLEACWRVLKKTGSIYLHCDYRASHYLKMVMDKIFGVENFRNEIVWHYFMGGKAKSSYGRKHDIILFYTKSNEYTFNQHYKVRRLPYKPSLSNPSNVNLNQKVLSHNGFVKPPQKKTGQDELGYYSVVSMDDVWDISGVFNLSDEYIGYPTQKPKELLEAIIRTSSNKRDTVLDPFCGCGTAMITAQELERKWIGIDISEKAYEITKERFKKGQHRLSSEEVFHVRKLEKVKKMSGYEFERWVNDVYDAYKPSPDRGVDGITKDSGIPIQTKTSKVGYDVVSQFYSDVKSHPKVSKPVRKMRIVSQKGFKGSARQQRDKLEGGEKSIELITPEEILNEHR